MYIELKRRNNMKKIYAFGFTYDDFADGGFSPNFISFSKEECFNKLKKENNDYAVVSYDFEKDFDYDEIEIIAIVRDGQFTILTDLEELKEKAFQLGKNLISTMNIINEPNEEQYTFIDNEFKKMGLPNFASFQVFERLFT